MEDFTYQTPQMWFESLEGDEKFAAERTIALLTRFGAQEPLSWVASENIEGIAQTARFLFLHEVRQILSQAHLPQNNEEATAEQPYHVEEIGGEAAQKLIDSGVDVQKLDAVYRAGASFALNEMLNLLDGTFETAAAKIVDAPRWSLREIRGEVGKSRLTGRGIDGLHESFDSLYKSDI